MKGFLERSPNDIFIELARDPPFRTKEGMEKRVVLLKLPPRGIRGVTDFFKSPRRGI